MHPLRAALSLLAIAAGALPAHAQIFTRPELHWETIHTSHFTVHFPRAMRPWALDAAGRLESVRDAVVRIVGNGAPDKVTVVVDDPYNISNGAALPVLNAPTIVLWPTPPVPADAFGASPDWAELLAVHEFTHIVHLTRQSRNTLDRVVWHVLPVDLGPVARRAPRWVMEGYATYVEGVLTAGGRPHSPARAAVLRQWAIEGRLPTYRELNGSGRFLGSDMAYLTGSAFLEWLVARAGEQSLPNLWRRMTARLDRDFTTAFIGVYGDSPAVLYGRFTAELTGKALHAARAIVAAGLDSGRTFQHLTWYTGDPAVSRDGRLIAIPVRQPGRPTKVIVWSTTPIRTDSIEHAARRWLLAQDPQDVPAVHVFPSPRRPVATLEAVRGLGYDAPRFLSNSTELLVTHDEPLRDGAVRPDLFEWDLRSGDVHRITHGAAVRDADPSPDGRTAAGVRCHGGVCDVVRVRLADGHLEVLLRGSPQVEYNHPRFSPDGHALLVAVHDSAGWWTEEIEVGDLGAVDRGRVGPRDGASRYGATYVARGTAVVTVSDLGGVEHLELIDRNSGTVKALAATIGGIASPDGSPFDTAVYFLTTSARGRDLHSVPLRAAREQAPPSPPASLFPAAVPATAERPDSFPTIAVSPPTPYGLGPREYRYLPGIGLGPAGRYATLTIMSSDPVGRLDWTAQGALGDPGTWRGGALAAAWRGWPVNIGFTGFGISDYPSRASAGTFAPTALDASLQGGIASLSVLRYGRLGWSAARIGGSVARFAPSDGTSGTRDLAFAGYSGVANVSHGSTILFGGAGVLGTVGRTDGVAWRRVLARGWVSAGIAGFLLRYTATYTAVNATSPLFERPVVGGDTPPLTDTALLSQRLAVPALPVGVVGGRQLIGQRLEDNRGALSIFYERFTTPADRGLHHDLYGAEMRGGIPPVPFLATPGASGVAGLAYSIADPFKYKLRAYVALRYTP